VIILVNWFVSPLEGGLRGVINYAGLLIIE